MSEYDICISRVNLAREAKATATSATTDTAAPSAKTTPTPETTAKKPAGTPRTPTPDEWEKKLADAVKLQLGAEKAARQMQEARTKGFCERQNLWAPRSGPEGFTGGTIGPGAFSQIANSWQSSWVNRPESSGPGAKGFSFDPKFMRRLFKWGAYTFQQRCRETLSLLNVPVAAQDQSSACAMAPDALEKHLERSFQPLSACHADDHEIPECK